MVWLLIIFLILEGCGNEKKNIPIFVKEVSVEYDSTRAIAIDGSLWCWGEGVPGKYEPRINKPIQIETEKDWSIISRTCGIKTNDSMWCWGGISGIMEYGTIECWNFSGTDCYDSEPLEIEPGTKWVSVSFGFSHICGIMKNHTLWCYGFNEEGQLGDGTNEPSRAFKQVGSNSDWSYISAGYYYTCGIKFDGSLWCWGKGPLMFGWNKIPERVGMDTDWRTISTSSTHLCGIKFDNTLWCWGRNESGQLGDGTNEYRVNPTQVGTDTHWQYISVGEGYTCGVKTDGTLWCWGSNRYYVLGIGTNEMNKNSPTQVGKDADWQSVSAGDNHTCGIKQDRTLCVGAGITTVNLV
jgi:alpha-tubulin suppressor-like RCC1 family protein